MKKDLGGRKPGFNGFITLLHSWIQNFIIRMTFIAKFVHKFEIYLGVRNRIWTIWYLQYIKHIHLYLNININTHSEINTSYLRT